MPRRKTLSSLRARAQKLADKENDDHIESPEWAESINEVFGDLFQIVADGAGAYWQRTHTITADGSVSYNEPTDHLSTVCLEHVASSGERTPLDLLLAQERHLYSGPLAPSLVGGQATAYSLIDDQIFLYPKPSSGTYELLYIPQSPDLTTFADGDLVDVVNIYGEQFLVYGVAAIALSKSESDVRFLLSRQQRAEQKLIEWAAQRSFHDGLRRYTELDMDGVNG